MAKERRYKTDLVGYKNALLKPYPFVKVDSFSLEGLHNDSVALTHTVNFHFNLKKAGGYYLLTANLFTGMNENPFMTQHRFTDIDFGTKYNCVVVGSFSLPPSLATEALPANKKLVSPDRTMAVSRFLEKKENQVNLRFEFEITREKFAADEYEMVKAFFKEAVDLMNEPVVLKDR
jgi:hypothetical protein